jgi:hypothetical protein
MQKILPPQGFDLWIIHLAASHHIDYTPLAHIKAGSQAKKIIFLFDISLSSEHFEQARTIYSGLCCAFLFICMYFPK